MKNYCSFLPLLPLLGAMVKAYAVQRENAGTSLESSNFVKKAEVWSVIIGPALANDLIVVFFLRYIYLFCSFAGTSRTLGDRDSC